MKETIPEIYERCKKILNFLASLSQDEKSTSIFSDFDAALDATYEKKNLRGLKMINRDLDAWAKSLNKKQKDELNALLADDTVYKQQEELIARVIKDKAIRSAEDYEQIIDILKDASEGDKNFSDMGLLETLVATYESAQR